MYQRIASFADLGQLVNLFGLQKKDGIAAAGNQSNKSINSAKIRVVIEANSLLGTAFFSI